MQKEGQSSRSVATSRTVLFVLLGVLVLGAGMIGFSVLSPKQLTTCIGVGGSSAMICEMHYVSGGTICAQEVSPRLSEAACLASPSFWQFTKFWVFDLGIVGLILVVSSASIAALVLAHGKYYWGKTKTRQEKIKPILPKANPQHLPLQLLQFQVRLIVPIVLLQAELFARRIFFSKKNGPASLSTARLETVKEVPVPLQYCISETELFQFYHSPFEERSLKEFIDADGASFVDCRVVVYALMFLTFFLCFDFSM